MSTHLHSTSMTFSLYLNGVYESVLEEIIKAQKNAPSLLCYLQPYKSMRIAKLSESVPNIDKPVTLYLSKTDSLSLVSYKAEIVGWENKLELSEERLQELNIHIKQYQPKEQEIYMTGGNGEACINLLSVRKMRKLSSPVHISSLIKISDDTSLKTRTRPGGWSYVKPIPEWVGLPSQTAITTDLSVAFEKAVSDSKRSNCEDRNKRLANAPKFPEPIQLVTQGFKRNPDVVAAVLNRAAGKCEECDNEAPFKRASDGSPYLEVHHKILLSRGGEDTVKNAVALCPNCHRKFHYGIQTGSTDL